MSPPRVGGPVDPVTFLVGHAKSSFFEQRTLWSLAFSVKASAYKSDRLYSHFYGGAYGRRLLD